ncbi:Inner membrane ABC transporter permease protein ycjP [uncultured Clostridium sp.]|uniref:carbohydrate ABC transporter permease n=1 Tax=Enterocloster citroniae TaxID=358743 RepID=UPI0008214B2D|nr:carbohydrate ABC transporter permease [Clostridium sp.]MCD8277782.1 carbohydrate ABC transporter permease [Enterocloster citroniae]SCI11844.1 Inner membrane ABC transporter permease protein ycjP [uncultured Clostridium sp.]
MKRKKATISGVVKYVLLSVYAMVTVFPLFWTFTNSFRTNNQIFSTTVLLPESFTYLVNYTNILKENILGAYWNSFSLTVTTLVIMLLCVIPAAFLMSQYRFHLSKALQNLFVVGIIIPRLAILITTFQNFNTFGFLNHKYPITLCYAAFEIPMAVFLMVGFMQSLPGEIAESAIIDGCSSFQVLTKIIIPMSQNGIVTVIILSFVSIWNEYAYAMVLLSNKKFHTLPMLLASAKGEFFVDYGLQCAAVMVAVVPIIVVYIFLQRKIVDGMVAGAVKG